MPQERERSGRFGPLLSEPSWLGVDWFGGDYSFVVRLKVVRHTDEIRMTVGGFEHDEDCLHMIAEFVQDLAAAGIVTE